MLIIKSIIAIGILLAINSTGGTPLSLVKCLADIEYHYIPVLQEYYDPAIKLMNLWKEDHRSQRVRIADVLKMITTELQEKDKSILQGEKDTSMEIELLKMLFNQEEDRLHENKNSAVESIEEKIISLENIFQSEKIKDLLEDSSVQDFHKAFSNQGRKEKIDPLNEKYIPMQQMIARQEGKKIDVTDGIDIPMQINIFSQEYSDLNPWTRKRAWVELVPGAFKSEIIEYPPNKLSNELKKLLALKAAMEKRTKYLNGA